MTRQYGGSAFRRTVVLVTACALAWWAAWPERLDSHGSLTTTVLFDREIVRILNTHCVTCHSEGSLAFPLSTYEQTWVKGRAIRTEVLRRHMPPWAAVPGYGQFANDNSLTLREMQFIVSWVEGLGPRNAGSVFLNVAGAPARPAEVRAVAHTDHWQLGEPDLTRTFPASVVEANQPDVVRKTVIDLGLTAERRVRALEFMPSDRRVVRAATFTLESTGQWLASWTPWYGFTRVPDGVMYRLPAGSRVVVEVHYRGTAERVEAGGTLGLFLADRAASRVASDLVLEGDTRATTRLAADTWVWAIEPRLGDGVAALEVSARRPDGGTDILLFAKDPPRAWPTPYVLKEPRLLRRGTELSFVARSGRARVAISRY